LFQNFTKLSSALLQLYSPAPRRRKWDARVAGEWLGWWCVHVHGYYGQGKSGKMEKMDQGNVREF